MIKPFESEKIFPGEIKRLSFPGFFYLITVELQKPKINLSSNGLTRNLKI